MTPWIQLESETFQKIKSEKKKSWESFEEVTLSDNIKEFGDEINEENQGGLWNYSVKELFHMNKDVNYNYFDHTCASNSGAQLASQKGFFLVFFFFFFCIILLYIK